jgi:hypothetical protein
MHKINDLITFDFTTHNPATGMVQDGDSLPTCKVFEDNNDAEILTPTAVKRAGQLGDYRVSIAATTGNGFEVGRTYNVVVSATVNSISAKSRVGVFVLDSKRLADLNDLAQAQILSDATPFPGGRVDAAVSTRATPADILTNPVNKVDGSKIDVAVSSRASAVDSAAIVAMLNLLKKYKANRLLVAGNQLTIYDDDGLTPILVQNLFNQAGEPAMDTVYERTPA